MSKIRVIAKNELGTAALNKHLEDWEKAPEGEKKVAKALGISQAVISKEPLIVEIKIGGLTAAKKVSLYKMMGEIDKTMFENGAQRRKGDPGSDYMIEVYHGI